MKMIYKIILVLTLFAFTPSGVHASNTVVNLKTATPIATFVSYSAITRAAQDTTESKPTISSKIDPQNYEHKTPVIYKIAYGLLFVLLMSVCVWLIRKFWFNLKRNKKD